MKVLLSTIMAYAATTAAVAIRSPNLNLCLQCTSGAKLTIAVPLSDKFEYTVPADCGVLESAAWEDANLDLASLPCKPFFFWTKSGETANIGSPKPGAVKVFREGIVSKHPDAFQSRCR